MSRAALLLSASAVSALAALAAFGVVHHRWMVVPALIAAMLASATALLVRRPWAHLPRYSAVWLDLGVAVAGALLAVVAHTLGFGAGFIVLRAAELILLLGGALLIGVVTTGLAYSQLRLVAEVQAQTARLTALENAALSSRLATLSAQINPHFLFNALNTVAEVVHHDEDAAEDLITDLSTMMRMALRGSTGLVTLEQELDVVQRLLRIEAARLGGRLNYAVTGVQDLTDLDVQVPGLLIQPLVENAVKYGVASRAEGGHIDVQVTLDSDRATIVIADDGAGLPDDVAEELARGILSLRGTEGHGGGLRNSVERLRLTWPDGHATLRHDRSAPGTRLVLELPVGPAATVSTGGPP